MTVETHQVTDHAGKVYAQGSYKEMVAEHDTLAREMAYNWENDSGVQDFTLCLEQSYKYLMVKEI